MKLLQLIVRTSINASVALLFLWGSWHLTRWLWPDRLWESVAFFVILAIDYALIISGIAPHGFRDWAKLWGRK